MAFIIAEAACSHGGDLSRAMAMVEIAATAGCDAIKFQAFVPELIPNVTDDEIAFLKRCVWSEGQWENLRNYCGNHIKFMATPFDKPSVDLLLRLGVDTIKVPSGRLTDKPFADYIRDTGKNVIASTGMLDWKEVRYLHLRYPKWRFLHCTSSYPCPTKDVNLSVLRRGMFAGLSDHTRNTWIPAIAVAMGAEIVEKHFTLSRSLDGPDQKVSLEPDELREMMDHVRFVETALGSMDKRVQKSELAMLYRKVTDERQTETGDSKPDCDRG